MLFRSNKSSETIKDYAASVKKLARFLRDNNMPDDIEGVGPEHIRGFLVAQRHAHLVILPRSSSPRLLERLFSCLGERARRESPQHWRRSR